MGGTRRQQEKRPEGGGRGESKAAKEEGSTKTRNIERSSAEAPPR